ncbi:unknown [Firmicutes bacterium CAG:227]|nr:unknown [Firmicutes bacterium CAG:227]
MNGKDGKVDSVYGNNRNILECKCDMIHSLPRQKVRNNRNILECKFCGMPNRNGGS